MMLNLDDLKTSFWGSYESIPRIFSAPGRVNLIGEHTDYNDGFVLPIAVNRRTFVAGALNTSPIIRVHSLELDERAEIDLSQEPSKGSPHWVNYVEGVARVLKGEEARITGADLSVKSTVPMGSGMSSSAALEISVGFTLIKLSGIEIQGVPLALAAQKAEHLYAGTKCGLMDQLAAFFGRKGNALLIDCRSFERTPIELKLEGRKVVVCHTHVKHQLASSAYNERRAECERGVEIFRKQLPAIKALRDVSLEDFKTYEHLLPEPIKKRCRHVIAENERTLKAANALRTGNIPEFGRLMLASHQSLRDDYEVSCLELDIMVALAMKQAGVAGARMTGGGFGGCTVNLVDEAFVDRFSDVVMREYRERTGIEGSIYVVDADEGVREELQNC